jgi:hypothetical protein
MKMYRVEYVDRQGEHRGFTWHDTGPRARKERDASVAEDDQLDPYLTQTKVIEFTYSRDGIRSLLNLHASHPDNG